MVFCDLSTPRADGEWSAYLELRRRLIAYGVPAHAIAFIHDAKTDEARARLFARCRSGQIAVLVGSTQKMGVGTNIHSRAVALHHIDCPWRPADIEQREGRIIRQGNQNDEVAIYRYVTEGSFDVYMWQVCERKAGFIDQIMRGQVDGREIDDVGENVLSYAEVKALATGNPLVIEQAGVQAELAKLDRRALAHHSDQRRLQGIATYARRDAELHRQKAAALSAALTRRVDTAGDKFRMEIDGQVHTSRTDAGALLFTKAEAAIAELLHRQGRDETRLVHIGRLGGFAVTLQGIKSGLDVEARITVQVNDAGVGIPVRLKSDDLRSRSPERVVAGIEASIRNLDSRVEEAERRGAEADAEAERAEARLQPFPDQARLDQLQRRYTEIVDQREADAAAAEARRAGTAPVTDGGEEAQSAPPSPAGSPAVAEHPTDLGPAL